MTTLRDSSSSSPYLWWVHLSNKDLSYPFLLANLEKIVALLHDTVEKTTTTYDDLRNKGFSGDVIEAINSLTRRKEEGYDKYISRVSKNKIAVAVKISDLNDHLKESKKRGMTKKKKDRIKKYEKAKQKLLKE